MRRSRAMGRRGPGLLGTMARTAVIAGTATAVVGSVSNSQKQRANEHVALSNLAAQQQQLQTQQEALAQQQQWLASQQPANTSAPSNSSSPGGEGLTQETLTLLQQLGEMQKQGILTAEEFTQQKARILGS